MKQLILLLLSVLFILPVSSFAQNEASTWLLGNGYGLKFNDGAPAVVKAGPNNSAITYTYSNSAGELVLFANLEGIFNKDGRILENGRWGLRNLGFDMFIIPKPGSTSLFYVFYTFGIENDEAWYYWTDYQAIGYALVDMAANNGAGKVLEKDKIVYQDTHGYFAVSGNCGNNTYWLVGETDTNMELNTDQFFAFKITEQGIAKEPVRSEPVLIGNTQGIQFSPTGKKLIFSYRGYEDIEGLGLSEFNTVTGEVSKAIRVDEAGWNATFSASGNKLYLNSYSDDVKGIWQMDISSGNQQQIVASKKLVYPGPLSLTQSQLGPDGKIYLAKTNYHNAISVINYPERDGVACEVVPDVIKLPQLFFGLLPVFPSNYLYAITENLNAGPDQELKQGQEVKLGGKFDSNTQYYWEPADFLSDPTSPTPTFEYTSPDPAGQELTYRIYVKDGVCKQSDEVKITIRPLHEEITPDQIPNIFTPNGDGINDTFAIPVLELFPDNELVIVNRLGTEVYRRKGYQGHWNGENVTAGLYYYQLYIKKLDRYYKGWVEVMR
ncbi:gliding motility-associated C-terminal domain-containing protein [Pontibacter sp. H259]|uniref:T9SS type B sorting domain-containing protein n=1 Tax=Pontibacter sp. H259 TaxID=3133421 RepID=UPI0030C11860